MRDERGGIWLTVEEHEAERNTVLTTEEEAAMDAWEASEEGQRVAAEIRAEMEAERLARDANPNRLSNHIPTDDMPLLFGQAVQSIYDETGEPCRMNEAGERAGMDKDEYLIGCCFASLRGLIRHPERNGYIGINLWEPGVG